MKTKNNGTRSFSEPMYDDVTLEMFEILETEELITALIEYCASLEKKIIDLRHSVNILVKSHSF